MDNNELNIQITATDDASPVLEGVAQSADQMSKMVSDASEGMAKAVDSASKQMTESLNLLSPAEEVVVAQAQAIADNWDVVMNNVSDATTVAAEAVTKDFDTIATASRTASLETIQTWESSLADLRNMMSMTTEQMDAQLAGTGKKGSSSMDGMMSYFRYYMGGSMAGQAATGLMALPQQALTAAEAGASTMQIQQIQDHIAQLRASIATQRASLQHSTGTSAQLAARHAQVAADVAKENTQIALLQQNLQVLEASYKNTGKEAEQYAQESQKLSTDWSAFLGTVGKPLLENLNQTLKYVDQVVVALTEWAKQNPVLAKALMITIISLGSLFMILSKVLYTVAGLKIAMMIFSGSFGGATTAVEGLGGAIGGSTGLLKVFSLGAAGPWLIALTALAAAVVAVSAAFTGLQSTMENVNSSASTLRSTVNSPEFQKLLSTSTGAEHAKLLRIQAADQASLTNSQNIANRYSGIGGGVNAVTDYVGGMFSNITKLATGGIVRQPTIALVGEAGPEAVIPLSSFAGGDTLSGSGGSSSGGNIVVNITGTFLSRDAAHQLGNMLAESLNRNIKLKSFV